jgi:hypothetical protein
MQSKFDTGETFDHESQNHHGSTTHMKSESLCSYRHHGRRADHAEDHGRLISRPPRYADLEASGPYRKAGQIENIPCLNFGPVSGKNLLLYRDFSGLMVCLSCRWPW